MEKQNLIFVVALIGAAVILFFAITSAIGSSVYMMPVDQAVASQAEHEGETIRVAGNVVPQSIRVSADNEATFRLTKGGETIEVAYTGPRPDEFRDCAQVIVTGTLSADRTFAAEDMVAKCPSKYDELPGGCEVEPDGVREARNKNGAELETADVEPAAAAGY